MSSVAIVQSNYIPWKGYFDLIAFVDRFVLYDVVQFTKNDWRNRNRVKTASGPVWLTVPVAHTGRFGQRIDEAVAADDRWRRKHWRTIEQAYVRAPFFRRYRDEFEALYLGSTERRLSVINRDFVAAIATALEISTPIEDAASFDLPEDRNERLVAICRELGADEYLSGPSAQAYLDVQRFEAAGIRVRFMDYSGYPEYPQLHPPFEHRVSAMDLLFNTGAEARSYMLSTVRAAPRA